MTDQEKDELNFIRGEKAFASRIFRECLQVLGNETQDKEAWRLERQSAIETLRQICDEYGDNDWEDDLHLSDILEKHLRRHLE